MDRKTAYYQDSKGMSTSKDDEVKYLGAEKPLGLYGATSFIFCSMIGTGIFISVSDTFNVLSSDNILMILSIWFFGGLISLVGSLCYAELGSRYPQTGGECVYFEEILGKKFSVLFVIMFIFVVKTITLAALALTSAKYLVNSFEFDDFDFIERCTKIAALSVLLVTFLMNCCHRTIVTKFLGIFALLKFASMIIIIGVGLYSLIKSSAKELKVPLELKGFSLLGLASAVVSICWCFEGWNGLGLKAGDVRNPSRNLVGSSVIGVFLVSFTYVLCVISYLTVLGFKGVRSAETVALSLAKIKLGYGFPVISILICLSAIGSTTCNLYAIGGVVTYAGHRGILPSIFSLVHRTTRVPYVATVSLTLISCAFVFIKFQVLLNYCSFISWFFYFLSFTSLWIVKVRGVSCSTSTFSVNYVFILFGMLVCACVVFVCFYSYFYGCLMIASLMFGVFLMQFLPFKISKKSLLGKFYQNLQTMLMSVFNLESATDDDI